MFSIVSPPQARNRKIVSLGVKLDIINRIDRGERNKDIVRALKLPASTVRTIYTQKEKILHAARAIDGLDRSQVVSFNRHPLMEKMEERLLAWLDEGGNEITALGYQTLKEKSVSIFNELKQRAVENRDETVQGLSFKGSHGWYVRFLRRGRAHVLKMAEEKGSAEDSNAGVDDCEEPSEKSAKLGE